MTPANKGLPASRRSRKAPTPPMVVPIKPQAARRRRRAAVAGRKDTTILQTDRGPRAAWSASKPRFPKR
jgi:hypothetical protein